MARIAGTSYIKVDGEQLSLTGGMEIPLNLKVKETITDLGGGNDYKETHRAPYMKGTFKVPKGFPLKKVIEGDNMTITSELANGWVYVLKNAWLEGEANYNPEDGTVDLQFNAEEGFFQ